ncbi:MAG TPA: class I SAM-dependent methyltransferase [Steroidobacteraceae bacterium]|nr:class I SAM-dependent methyltransferase [Steroidobacteraceae bacterium]
MQQDENKWDSPQLPQRKKYEVLGPIERWMVPLLGDAIEAAITNHAQRSSSRTCLDVGCGSQPWRSLLEELGFAYEGMDFNQNFEGTVQHLAAIDVSLPASLQGRQFDFVLCTEVLEHVPRWPEAFGNLSTLLAPGGKLLITAPHIWLPHEEPADFFRPTSLGIQYHAQSVGLRTVELTRLGSGYDVLSTALAAVTMRLKPSPLARPIRMLPRFFARQLLKLLQTNAMRRHVELQTDLYLSTLAVFEKPRQPTIGRQEQ